MSTKMLMTMRPDQRLMMSQQLRQAITLLQYNTLDLKQLVQHYIEMNPLLEIEEPARIEENQNEVENTEHHDLQMNIYSADYSKKRNQYHEEESVLENYAIPKTLRDYLFEQTLLCQFSQDEQIIAEAIIDAINDDGYLTMPLNDLAKLLPQPVSETILEDILRKIQTFDPSGIGARDIRECLLVQLNQLSDKNITWDTAYEILNNYFEQISSGDSKKIMKQLELSTQQYKEAMLLIRTLNAKPGMQFSTEMNINLEPELYVKKIKNKWQVFLAESLLTQVKINKQYQEIIRQHKKQGSYATLKQELEEARNLLKGLKKRNETLLAVGSYIIELQQDFLERGAAFMKPMNIVDVSQVLNIHESTVSRVTTGKYIMTNRGVFELKYFFPSHVGTQSGDTCSAIAVKSYIKEIINQETVEHALSDEEIAEMLREKGITISRRTVAKYRESMKIFSSYQRAREQLV